MSTTTETIKLTRNTLSILKNFSHINSNLLVKEGNILTTISPAKNIVAEATIDEYFHTEFGIWDLSKLLGTISLFDDPEFEFGEKSMNIISSGGATVSYFYSEPRLLTTLDRKVNMPEHVVSFNLTEEIFSSLQRSSSVLQLPDLCIRSNDIGEIELVVLDKSSPTTNSFKIIVGENETNSVFSFFLKMENLKLLNGDYSVDVCKSTVCRFTHSNIDMVYYVALESDSSYGD